MTLDHDNVVLAVKPFSQAETSHIHPRLLFTPSVHTSQAETSGVVQPGDKV